MSKVLGEGSYGCIHLPSLTCNNKTNIKYNNNYVSKSLIDNDSDIEKHHMNFIQKIDPTFEYHLKTGEECKLDNNKLNNKALDKCSIFENRINNNNIKLLIMENGGLNIEEYSETIKTKKQSLLFWIKIQKTIKAVQLYLKHNIIHNDLKGQNILFNEKTQKIAIIDFGLMHSKKTKENASKNYQLYKIREAFNLMKNKESIFIQDLHWSWPLENEYIEKNEFIKFIEKTPFKKHQQYIENIVDDIEYMFKIKSKKIKTEMLNKDETLNTYNIIVNDIILGTPYSMYNIFNDYLNNIYSIQLEYKNATNKSTYYDKFLETHLNTVDIYGLGIAFITSLTPQQKLLPKTLVNEFYELFYRMITPIVKNRININDLLETYETIINKYIKEYNLIFINNQLIKIPINDKLIKQSKRSKLFNSKLFNSKLSNSKLSNIIRNKTVKNIIKYYN